MIFNKWSVSIFEFKIKIHKHLLSKISNTIFKNGWPPRNGLFISSLLICTPLSGTECKRLREFFQQFYPKCKIIWDSPIFWSTFKPTTKINFFALKPAVQSHFTGKWLGLGQIFISQTLFRI